MHPEAASFVAMAAYQLGPFDTVLELGGRYVNGSVRPNFVGARYVSVDIVAGPEVDVVADATTYRPDEKFDVVVCAEVLEHVDHPEEFVATAWSALRPGGWLILTAACPPRAAHSGTDGGALRNGEWYQNINPDMLRRWLVGWDQTEIEVHDDRGDVYAVARRP